MNNAPTPADRKKRLQAELRDARAEAGLTQVDMAAHLGIERDRYAKYETRSVIPADLAAKAAEVLGIDVTRLLVASGDAKPASPVPVVAAPATEAQPPPADGFIPNPIDLPRLHLRNLPIFGSVVGGVDGAFEMNGQVLDYVERPQSLLGVKNAYGVYVSGESMSPRYEPGWTLHVHPTKPARIGDNVVVQVRSPDPHAAPLAYVKVLVSRNRGGKLVVKQFNPPCELEWPVEDVVSMHRIVGVAEE